MSSRGPAEALHSSVDRGRRAVLICELVGSFLGADYGAERDAIVRKVEQSMRRRGRLWVAVLLGTLLSGAYRDARGGPTSGDKASGSSRRSPPIGRRVALGALTLYVAVAAHQGALPVPVLERRGAMPPLTTSPVLRGNGASTLAVHWISLEKIAKELTEPPADWIWRLRAMQWTPQDPASWSSQARR